MPVSSGTGADSAHQPLKLPLVRRYGLVVTDAESNSTIGALQGFVVILSEELGQAVYTFTSAQGTFQVSSVAHCTACPSLTKDTVLTLQPRVFAGDGPA